MKAKAKFDDAIGKLKELVTEGYDVGPLALLRLSQTAKVRRVAGTVSTAPAADTAPAKALPKKAGLTAERAGDDK